MGELRVLDLFSGLGGFSLGLERAGMKTVAFCEIDPFCQKVLRKNWPDETIPIYDDIRTLTGERITREVGTVELVAGGWPCQPFSHAGERRGEEDDRYLWPEVARLLEELRPNWFLGENVAGIISMGLDRVLSDLDDLGYASRAYVIPACAVNASHRRDRVWVVANAYERQRNEQEKEVRTGGNTTNSCSKSSTPDPLRVGSQGSGRAKQPSHQAENGNREIHRTEHALRWPVKSPVRGRDDGIPRRLDQDRLKALGNAVVPQIPELIGRAILAAGSE